MKYNESYLYSIGIFYKSQLERQKYVNLKAEPNQIKFKRRNKLRTITSVVNNNVNSLTLSIITPRIYLYKQNSIARLNKPNLLSKNKFFFRKKLNKTKNQNNSTVDLNRITRLSYINTSSSIYRSFEQTIKKFQLPISKRFTSSILQYHDMNLLHVNKNFDCRIKLPLKNKLP